MNSLNKCLIPWRSIFIAPDGRVSPCCAYYDGDYKAEVKDQFHKNPVIEKVRNDFTENLVPKGCLDCFYRESRGLESRRLSMPITYKNLKIDLESDQVRIQHLDISFGNLCNMKCRFCRSENSSAWIKDFEVLNKMDSTFWARGPELGIHDNSSLLKQLLKEDLRDLRFVEIKGGEPFLYKHHADFLRQLCEVSDPTQVELLYCTNGTVFLPELIEYWERFRRVTLVISVDGTQDTYKYIRGENFSLENKIEKNIKLFDQFAPPLFSFKFYYTVCAYNIFDMNNFKTWVESLNLKNTTRIHFEPLTDPRCISTNALPLDIRYTVASTLPDSPQFSSIRHMLLTENTDQPNLLKSFMKYTTDLDQVRKTDIKKSIPELAEFF